MPIPSELSWRFRIRRTDSGGSYLRYNSTLKNPDDAVAVVGTAPQTAYTKLLFSGTSKNVVRNV